jgi:hypothetical protein
MYNSECKNHSGFAKCTTENGKWTIKIQNKNPKTKNQSPKPHNHAKPCIIHLSNATITF